MDDQQLVTEEETQQDTYEAAGSQQVVQQQEQTPQAGGDSLTAEDVSRAVDESLRVYQEHNDAAIGELSSNVQSLGQSVQLLAANDEQQQQDQQQVQTVRVDASQVETAKGALRVLCTECLLVVIVLALIAGLQGWAVVAERWRNG